MMPLYPKHIAFIGNFKNGSLPLKDIVYQAGGAPTDSIAQYTHYLVVGEGGKDTELYRKWEHNIRMGHMAAITEEELRKIAVRLIPAPILNREPKEGVIVTETDEARERSKDLETAVWGSKRYKFVLKCGELQSDGRRLKIEHRLNN